MSGHIWDSKSNSDEPRTIYIAGGSLPDREISRDEALQSGSYVGRHYCGDILDHVEIVSGGKNILVMYYGRAWPDSGLVQWHQKNYGSVPFEVYTPIEQRHGVSIRTVFEMDGTGTLRGKTEHILGSRGEVLCEKRITEEGKPLGRLEYIYNDVGKLILTREYGPDGELYEEIPSEPE